MKDKERELSQDEIDEEIDEEIDKALHEAAPFSAWATENKEKIIDQAIKHKSVIKILLYLLLDRILEEKLNGFLTEVIHAGFWVGYYAKEKEEEQCCSEKEPQTKKKQVNWNLSSKS